MNLDRTARKELAAIVRATIEAGCLPDEADAHVWGAFIRELENPTVGPAEASTEPPSRPSSRRGRA